MSRVSWLIYGHRGWIGGMICDLLEQNKLNNVLRAESRADNKNDVMEELETKNPNKVICVIGRTHGPNQASIDYLEDKLLLNLRDNLYGPVILAECCAEKNVHLTYFGTGCIFNYDYGHTSEVGFTETDEPNFFGSPYSVVKGYTDKLMRDIYDKTALNVRIRMPISSKDHPRNFVSKIIRYPKTINIPNSMTYLDELLPCVLAMAQHSIVGTINLTNPQTISHNEILELYKEMIDPKFTYENMQEPELSNLVKKRSNNCLDTSLLQSFFPHILPIREAIIDCFQNWKS